MENFSERLRSFSNPQIPWPHNDIMATPRLMALAGFFHNPLPKDRDRVECFLCQHRFGGWEPEDDPFAEHLKYSPACPYAILVCPRRGLGLDPQEIEESEEVILERQRRKSSHRIVITNPDTGTPLTQEEYAEMCRRTFSYAWPYKEESGRNADAMAAAGFIWAPGDDTPDAVLCLYCRLSLSNFEPDDDAWDEHMKRSRWCPYLNMSHNGLKLDPSATPSPPVEEDTKDMGSVAVKKDIIPEADVREGPGVKPTATSEVMKTPTPSSRLTNESLLTAKKRDLKLQEKDEEWTEEGMVENNEDDDEEWLERKGPGGKRASAVTTTAKKRGRKPLEHIKPHITKTPTARSGKEHLQSLADPTQPPKRKRGRPPKASKIIKASHNNEENLGPQQATGTSSTLGPDLTSPSPFQASLSTASSPHISLLPPPISHFSPLAYPHQAQSIPSTHPPGPVQSHGTPSLPFPAGLALTPDERDLTVEAYLRRLIERQVQAVRAEGERVVEEFRREAAARKTSYLEQYKHQ